MTNEGDRVSIRRFTTDVVENGPAGVVGELLREMEPDGGDFIIVRAPKRLAAAIEAGMRVQLFPYGVEP